MAKMAVIGANGQLGSDLVFVAQGLGYEVAELTHDDIEIADEQSVQRALGAVVPEVVVTTAAYQGAKTYTGGDQFSYYRVNALGVWHLARWCDVHGATLVYYSTDYVFGGDVTRQVPYAEDDHPFPVNAYGNSKLAGEYFVRGFCPRHYVVRVASLYGRVGSRAKGHQNFVKTVIEKARRGEALSVVDDQVMSPTWTRRVASKTLEMLRAGAPFGLYHMAGSGCCTWLEFAREIVAVAGLSARVEPCSTPAEAPGEVFRRPRYTALRNARLSEVGLGDLPPWQECVEEFIKKEMRG